MDSDLEIERPHYTLERCDGIFCELSPEDKVRWIAATKEGRGAIEKEHCTKNGLRWGIEEDEDGELFVVPPAPAFGAERILSENNLDYSGPAPLTAPLITDWVLGPDGKWEQKQTKTAREPFERSWVRRPDGKWED